MRQELRRQLEGDEGKRKTVYQDSKGWWTIAIGRLVDSRRVGAGLSEDEINYLFNNDVEKRLDELVRRISWFQNLDDARKGVLLNMAFQLGVNGLLGFKKTLILVEQRKYEEASREMLNSKWATEDSPARAARLSKQMRTGVWQYSR